MARYDDFGADAETMAATAADRLPPLLPSIEFINWLGRDVPAREWALNDWIPMRQATLLTGRGGVGKSLLAQLLCTCIAVGRPFLGIPVRQTPALYLTCEDDGDELWRRQAAINEGLGLTIADLIGKLTLVPLAGEQGNHLATFDMDGRLELSGRYEQLELTARTMQAGFIALDNASHLMIGDHNELATVTAFLNLLNGLAQRQDGAVLLMHHPNKAGDDWLGSVAWENQVRSRIFMKPSDQEGDLDARSIINPKANYSPQGSRVDFRWHRGTFVRGEDLPPSMAERLASTALATADNTTFLRCLDVRNGQERAVSEHPNSRTFAPHIFAAMPESKGIGRGRLEAALDRLFRVDEIERGFLWRADRKDVFGLRRKCADLRADPAPTGCADMRREEAPTCAVSHPSTTYIGRGPLGSAAPLGEA